MRYKLYVPRVQGLVTHLFQFRIVWFVEGIQNLEGVVTHGNVAVAPAAARYGTSLRLFDIYLRTADKTCFKFAASG